MSMRAKVIGYESAEQYNDKRRRIVLKFLDADSFAQVIRFPTNVVGLAGLKIDDVIEVTLQCPAAEARRGGGERADG